MAGAAPPVVEAAGCLDRYPVAWALSRSISVRIATSWNSINNNVTLDSSMMAEAEVSYSPRRSR